MRVFPVQGTPILVTHLSPGSEFVVGEGQDVGIYVIYEVDGYQMQSTIKLNAPPGLRLKEYGLTCVRRDSD